MDMRGIIVVALILSSAGCSVKRIAVNKLGDALSSGGSSYESDDDPDLVADALPFSLKLIESLLAESPQHKGLLLAAASGFTEYSRAFVEQRSDEAQKDNLEQSERMRARARRLYARAHAYGMRGLEAAYPGISKAIEDDPEAALARVRKPDVALLYWAAASLGLEISASNVDPHMIVRLPVVDAMIQRVVDLDEKWGDGSVPEFLISMESVRAGVSKEEMQKAMRSHFERSLALSGGTRASLFVSFAENACVPAQNRAEFQSMIGKALAIDVNLKPAYRLANLVAQRRAQWLLGRIDELFLEGGAPSPTP
jgi:predicted anti-sigma-YlaC factor YlaD